MCMAFPQNMLPIAIFNLCLSSWKTVPEPIPHKSESIGIDICVKSPLVRAKTTPTKATTNAIISVDNGRCFLIKIPPNTMNSGLKYYKIVVADALPFWIEI